MSASSFQRLLISVRYPIPWVPKKKILLAGTNNTSEQDKKKDSSMILGNEFLDSGIRLRVISLIQQHRWWIHHMYTIYILCMFSNRSLGHSSGLHTHRLGVPKHNPYNVSSINMGVVDQNKDVWWRGCALTSEIVACIEFCAYFLVA